eukprot:ANDGO_01357.mRNA.1 hypothetical protein
MKGSKMQVLGEWLSLYTRESSARAYDESRRNATVEHFREARRDIANHMQSSGRLGSIVNLTPRMEDFELKRCAFQDEGEAAECKLGLEPPASFALILERIVNSMVHPEYLQKLVFLRGAVHVPRTLQRRLRRSVYTCWVERLAPLLAIDLLNTLARRLHIRGWAFEELDLLIARLLNLQIPKRRSLERHQEQFAMLVGYREDQDPKAALCDLMKRIEEHFSLIFQSLDNLRAQTDQQEQGPQAENRRIEREEAMMLINQVKDIVESIQARVRLMFGNPMFRLFSLLQQLHGDCNQTIWHSPEDRTSRIEELRTLVRSTWFSLDTDVTDTHLEEFASHILRLRGLDLGDLRTRDRRLFLHSVLASNVSVSQKQQVIRMYAAAGYDVSAKDPIIGRVAEDFFPLAERASLRASLQSAYENLDENAMKAQETMRQMTAAIRQLYETRDGSVEIVRRSSEIISRIANSLVEKVFRTRTWSIVCALDRTEKSWHKHAAYVASGFWKCRLQLLCHELQALLFRALTQFPLSRLCEAREFVKDQSITWKEFIAKKILPRVAIALGLLEFNWRQLPLMLVGIGSDEFIAELMCGRIELPSQQDAERFDIPVDSTENWRLVSYDVDSFAYDEQLWKRVVSQATAVIEDTKSVFWERSVIYPVTELLTASTKVLVVNEEVDVQQVFEHSKQAFQRVSKPRDDEVERWLSEFEGIEHHRTERASVLAETFAKFLGDHANDLRRQVGYEDWIDLQDDSNLHCLFFEAINWQSVGRFSNAQPIDWIVHHCDDDGLEFYFQILGIRTFVHGPLERLLDLSISGPVLNDPRPYVKNFRKAIGSVFRRCIASAFTKLHLSIHSKLHTMHVNDAQVERNRATETSFAQIERIMNQMLGMRVVNEIWNGSKVDMRGLNVPRLCTVLKGCFLENPCTAVKNIIEMCDELRLRVKQVQSIRSACEQFLRVYHTTNDPTADR